MRTLFRLSILLLLITSSAAGAFPPSEKAQEGGELPAPWRIWLDEEIYPLISSEQRKAFLELDSEAQRQEFADRLWNLWGDLTGFGPDFRMMYEDRLRICREEFRTTTGERAALLLIHGPPETAFTPRCREVFYPLEFWYWESLDGVGNNVVVLFYQPNSVGPWRMWNPFEGRRVLYTPRALQQKLWATSRIHQPEWECYDSDTVMRLMDSAEHWGGTAMTLTTMSHLPRIDQHGPESMSSRFKEFSALVPKDAEPLDFSVNQAPLELQGGKVLMGFTLSVPSEGLGRSVVGETTAVQVDVVGEISNEDRMVDRFRYIFSVPNPSEHLDILFERSLRPGSYQLRIKLEDVHSEKAGADVVDFSVDPPEAAQDPGTESQGEATAPIKDESR